VPSVDDYIASQSPDVQPRLRELRATICAAVTEATEGMSYGRPTYNLGGRSVHFATAKRHGAFYATGIDAFGDEFARLQDSDGRRALPTRPPSSTTTNLQAGHSQIRQPGSLIRGDWRGTGSL
jgi:uncharacterized protein YdhG (YjbR/CyaY superfamily)